MKPYSDYRGLFSSIFLGVFFVILGLIPFVFSHAQTVGEIRDRIDQKSADILKLEEQIKIYQNELDGLGKQKNSLTFWRGGLEKQGFLEVLTLLWYCSMLYLLLYLSTIIFKFACKPSSF